MQVAVGLHFLPFSYSSVVRSPSKPLANLLLSTVLADGYALLTSFKSRFRHNAEGTRKRVL
jgi:hypothetical protein